ncbi:hydantoinase/oxoprolinase family protein [Streptomyces oceani]|uniref:Methylhydantoinase n=1 Tax=Streptomyces oceani TaxID=1075402 RepID=A0A1E7KH06_9ACTN|nr:hydantoinase/oxoprolinase family protein [Streptomyces oceani]OEV03156.1 methylhydantoinase [Streptomyces oceani]
MTTSRALRVGVDIGGTFTDMAILDDSGIVAVGKTLTTHQEPAAAVEHVLRQTLHEHRLAASDITSVVHGTTLVTNALIERRGAPTALLTTEGFRDVVEMGREHRYELYDLGLELPRPLVPRHLRFGVRERVLADGSVDTALDTTTVRQLAVELADAGVEAVAVCFLHSHTNSAHERQAREVIAAAAPHLRVALSSEVNPEIREFERSSTTVANVYVQQLVETYLDDLRGRLRGIGLRSDPLIMLSNGGLAAVDVARRFPIRMLESGPAGGALGALAFGSTAGRPDQLAFDMGGTTAKLCMIEGSRPLVTHTFEVDRVYRLRQGSGLPVRAPVIDMIEIGTGGGSIARVDALGLITVGPDSAGSEPGPVSYGRGGRHCTVTDADVVLGYLDPDGFLGGDMVLDAAAAAASIEEEIARPLGIGVAEAAWGIHATANESMANAARVHAVERGQDPARVPLFVSGGNGPLHGPGVAVALRSPAVVVPPAAGVLSALGFLSAPMSIDIVRSRHAPLGTVSPDTAQAIFDEMEDEGVRLLDQSGVPAAEVQHERTLDMRFVGQGSEVEVPVPPLSGGWREDLAARFAEQYRQRFGTVAPEGVETEILTWRVCSRGPDPSARLRLAGTDTASDALLGHRDAYFPASGHISTAVYDRYRLDPGAVLSGPALVREKESTLVVPPAARCTVTEDSSILVEFTQGEPR